MNVRASAGKSKLDLSEHVERLELRIRHPEEAELLAALNRWFLIGGELLIRYGDTDKCKDETFCWAQPANREAAS